jgi:hypothetical protein
MKGPSVEEIQDQEKDRHRGHRQRNMIFIDVLRASNCITMLGPDTSRGKSEINARNQSCSDRRCKLTKTGDYTH